jgi:sugar phosphate isomerase/epimerase
MSSGWQGGPSATVVSPNRLAISNIAWPADEFDEHLALLEQLGVGGLELATSLIWPEPTAATSRQRTELRERLASHNLAVVGLHSLLRTRPEAALFETANQRRVLIDHLKLMADLCADLGGQVMVFGSPRCRRRGRMTYTDALSVAAEACREVAEHAGERSVILCIEPLGPSESDFITCSEEGMDLVRLTGHPAFRLHLDAKAMKEAGENYHAAIGRNIADLCHFHVNDPGLTPPGSTGMDHEPIGRALRASGYSSCISIEMLSGNEPSTEVVRRSVAFVRRSYFEP